MRDKDSQYQSSWYIQAGLCLLVTGWTLWQTQLCEAACTAAASSARCTAIDTKSRTSRCSWRERTMLTTTTSSLSNDKTNFASSVCYKCTRQMAAQVNVTSEARTVQEFLRPVMSVCSSDLKFPCSLGFSTLIWDNVAVMSICRTLLVAKVLSTCVLQVQRKFRSDSVHVAPLETVGIITQDDNSPNNVKFPDSSQHSSAPLGMLSVSFPYCQWWG